MIKPLYLCVYCGAIATDRDHIVARSLVPGSIYSKTVPACRECNMTLSDRPLFCVRERAKYLLEAYRHKDVSTERLDWVRGIALVDAYDYPTKST